MQPQLNDRGYVGLTDFYIKERNLLGQGFGSVSSYCAGATAAHLFFRSQQGHALPLGHR